MSTNISTINRTRGDWIKIILTLLPAVMFLIPTNDIFTGQLRLFFVMTLIAIISFATDSLPQTGVALALPILYIITGLAEGATAFAAWLNYVPWMLIGGLILAVILEKTGLLKRTAYHCILLTGASYKGMIWGLTLTGVILNLFILDNACIPMAALSYGICRALELKPGKASGGIMISAALASLLPLNYLYSTNIMILLGFGESAGGPKSVGWFEIVHHQAPMVLYTIIMAFLCTIIFKPSEPINGKDYFRGELAKMGKMSSQEKKSLVILILLFTFLLTSNTFGIDAAWGFAVIPCLFFLPGVDLATPEDIKKVNWGFIFFVTACLSIGNVAGALGIGQLVANMALPVLSGKSYYLFYLFVWVLFFLMNFLMTPMAMMAAFTQPLTEICLNLGIEPMTLYYIISSGIDQIVLPYEYALYLIFFSFGMIRVADFAKIMSMKIVVNFALVFGLLIPYWHMMDMIFIH